ncbi:NACHT domain-containing protein [Streptomyces sp. NPDC002851]
MGSVQVPTRPATADYVFAAVAGAVLVAIGVFLGIGGGALITGAKARTAVAVACVCLAPPLVAALVSRRRRELRKLLVQVPGPDLTDIANRLGHVLKPQYKREEELGRIGDPMPLTVRWTPAAAGLGDHAASLAAAESARTDGAAAASRPISLEGEFHRVVDQYKRLPRGRLVVLGAPGAGKSVLVLRLAKELLASRRETEPVPVVLPLASWNPRTQPLLWWWAAGVLAEAHPAVLTVPDVPRRAVAHQLITSGRVLPTLDGFDELPGRVRVTALRQLREGLGDDGRLILTSRSAAYAAAVEAGDVRLPGMAAVELRQLDPRDVRAYLTASARPLSDGDGDDGVRTKWDPVLARIDDSADTTSEVRAVRAVLRTPLMVTLARAVYSDTTADPAELLPPAGFRTPRALERHLLGGYVDAAYARDGTAVPGSGQRWAAREARRWLGELALRQEQTEQPDIAWWHLDRMVPRRARMVLPLLLPVLWAAMVWLAAVPQTLYGLRLPVPMWLVVLVGGAAAVVVDWYGVAEHELPLPQRLLRPSLDLVRSGLRRPVLRILLVLGCLIIAVLWALAVLSGGGWEAPVAWTAVLLVVGLIGLRNGIRVPAEPEDHGPQELLRGDRRAALLLAPVALPASPVPLRLQKAGLATVLVTVVLWGTRQGQGLMSGGRWVALALLLLTGVAVWSCTASAWGRYCGARLWLAVRGTLPLRLTEFLQDAHRRGVLRRTGGSYRFRHLELRNELAAEAAERRARKPGGSAGSGGPGEDVAPLDEETLRPLSRSGARQGKVIVAGASLLALTAAFTLLGGGTAGLPPDGPIRTLPPACELLDARELRPALQDPVAVPMEEAKGSDSDAPRAAQGLNASYPRLKDRSTCAYAERAPFRPATTVTIGVGYMPPTVEGDGTASADRWVRQTWGARNITAVRGLGDAGTVADGEIDEADPVAVRFGHQYTVPMGVARGRVGNAVVTVDISRKFTRPAQLRETARIIAGDVLRNAGLLDRPSPKAPTLKELPPVDLAKESRFGFYRASSPKRLEGAVWQGHERSTIVALELDPWLWLALRLPPGVTCEGGPPEAHYDDEGSYRCTAETRDGPVTVGLVAYECDRCPPEKSDAFYARRPGPYVGTWQRHNRFTLYQLDDTADGARHTYLARSLRTWWQLSDEGEKTPFDYYLWMRVTAPEGQGETAEKIMNDAFTQQPLNGR